MYIIPSSSAEPNIPPSLVPNHLKDAAKVFVEMPQRNSKKQDQHATMPRRSPRFVGNNTKIQAEPTSVLRRSHRLLAKNRDDSADPKTPCVGNKGGLVDCLGMGSFVETPKECLKGSKARISGGRNGVKEANLGSGRCGGGGLSCLRRSLRLSGKEKVTSRLNFDELKKDDKHLGNKDMRVISGSGCNSASQQSVEGVIGLAAVSVGEMKKTGNSNRKKVQKVAKKCTGSRIDKSVKDSKAEVLGKGASLSVEKISKSGLGPSDQEIVGASSRAPVKGRVEKDARDVEKKPKCVGLKRKRNQVEDGCENQGPISGWTKEQDAALQKAYFATNPTPRFWKEVAKMVPGKSAQDCFNRIHADHLTPRPTQPRSRARLVNSSPISYSASKLLDSIRPKSKRPGHTKRKGHLAQKTMRQLLQKQCEINREQNADLFSLLEPKSSPAPDALRQGVTCSTPKQAKLLRRCQETSSSAQRKHCSRYNSMNEASVASPPVLKPVKNKALHEKYIDLLHAREAKRKAASARAAKSSLQVRDTKECRVQKNAVESAKNALLLDARDAINQFQLVQASFPDDDDDDVLFSDEDIDEGENRL